MSRPAYEELPRLGTSDVRHSWEAGRGPLGSLSELGPDAVRAAAGLVREGIVVPLNLALDAFDPPLFGRAAVEHRVIDADRNNREDVLDAFNPQSSSQWDGLGHVRAREFGFFGGELDGSAAAQRYGMDVWAARGIVGRGVLLDVVGWCAATGRDWDAFAGQTVTAADLDAIAESQDVEVRPGDIVCLRFGWTGRLLAAQRAGERPEITSWSGLHAGPDSARWVWDRRVAALAADNPAVESAPGDPQAGSLHRRLIPGLGTALAELLDLDGLAAGCARLGRWEFLFTAAPLPIRGGVSSPSNAMAVL